jgi:predicted acylesterase/phospholipase RssA
MNVQFQAGSRTAKRLLPFECIALVLQGGGALGAYQAGVYEALADANIDPDWVSIGAINTATAARVAKLRTSGRKSPRLAGHRRLHLDHRSPEREHGHDAYALMEQP